MGRRLIEVMQALIDQVHKDGYQHRALEDDIYAESQKRIAAEKDSDHWRQARQDAIEAGDLMQAEIVALRQQLAEAQQQGVDAMRAQIERLQKLADTVRSARSYFRGSTEWHKIEAALDELDAKPAPVAETAEGGT